MKFKHFLNRVFNSDYNYHNWFYFHRGNKPIFAWKGAKAVRAAMAIPNFARELVCFVRQHQQKSLFTLTSAKISTNQ